MIPKKTLDVFSSNIKTVNVVENTDEEITLEVEFKEEQSDEQVEAIKDVIRFLLSQKDLE